MGAECISHDSKEIIYINYSGLKAQEDMIKVLEDSEKLLIQSSGNALVLIDINDCILGPDFMKLAKEQGKKYDNKISKTAIIGVKGMKAFLLRGYNLFSGSEGKPFDTKELALNYLTS